MSKFAICRIGFVFLFILKASFAFADGMFMSQVDEHLYEPQQKSVLIWDGTTEEMILASAVRSQDVDNFVWIVPIQSLVKPVVEASDSGIFRDLVEYFDQRKPQGQNMLSFDGYSERAGGVEVIETKEIDFYDVAILKAENGWALVQWLNSNGYSVKEEAAALFDKYADYGNMFFVANKIDLKNKFSEVLDIAGLSSADIEKEIQQLRQSQNDEIWGILELLGQECGMSSLAKTDQRGEKLCQCAFDKIVKDFQSQGKEVTILPFDERYPYEKVIAFDKWQINLVSLHAVEGLYTFINYNGGTVFLGRTEADETANLIDANIPDATIREEALDYSNRITKILGELKKAFRRLKDLEEEEVKANFKLERAKKDPYGVLCYDDPAYESKYQRWFDNIKRRREAGEFKEFCDARASLRVGMATPLKFTFQPQFPYYPLEISRLSAGSGMVDLYVFSDKPVKDLNQVIVKGDAKKVNSELRRKLSGKVSIGKAGYVTRLSWSGEMKNLFADVKLGEK